MNRDTIFNKLAGFGAAVTLGLSAHFAKADVCDHHEAEKKAHIAFNFNDHYKLFGESEDLEVPPGSLAKMMTALLAVELAQKGKINLDRDYLYISENSKKRTFQNFESPWPRLKWRDALKLTLMRSYNDIAIAAAKDIAVHNGYKGSNKMLEIKAVELMNKKAREIGMMNTVYASASGLPADEGGEILTPLRAQTTARDQAILLDYIDEKMPELAALLGEKSMRYKGYRDPFVNSIALMHDARFDDYEFFGKTSSLEETCKSWALSIKDKFGNHVGIVTFGHRDAVKRANDTIEMMNEAFYRAGDKRRIYSMEKIQWGAPPKAKPQDTTVYDLFN